VLTQLSFYTKIYLEMFNLLVASLISFGLPSAHAQRPSVRPTPMNVSQVVRERKLENKERRLEIKARNAERKEEREAAMDEKRQERVAAFYQKLEVRVSAFIERLTVLSERILTRLETLAEEGESVATLTAEVASAQELIAEAESLLADLKTTQQDFLESEDPKAFYPTIRESVGAIKDSLKDAHSILVKVITQIKGLRVGGTENGE